MELKGTGEDGGTYRDERRAGKDGAQAGGKE